MVTYHVRRLADEVEEDRHRYQLFNRSGQLLLTAGRIKTRPPASELLQVRFSRFDGVYVATMDLPRTPDRRPDKRQNYALIYEHAVYALITALDLSSGTGVLFQRHGTPNKFDRLIIEAEGNRWLALRPADGGKTYLLQLYDAEPDDLPAAVDAESADLPDPIGFVDAGTEGYDFDLSFPAGRLAQESLVGLALVYLLDGLD